MVRSVRPDSATNGWPCSRERDPTGTDPVPCFGGKFAYHGACEICPAHAEFGVVDTFSRCSASSSISLYFAYGGREHAGSVGLMIAGTCCIATHRRRIRTARVQSGSAPFLTAVFSSCSRRYAGSCPDATRACAEHVKWSEAPLKFTHRDLLVRACRQRMQ